MGRTGRIGAVALLTLALATPALAARDLIFSSGAVTGVYFRVVLAACDIVNRVSDGKYNCIGAPGRGSVANVKGVMRGTFQLGVAQSDVVFEAVNGLGDWENDPQENLRTLFTVYPETVLLVVRAASGIESVAGLAGRGVNLGNPGSGSRVNAELVLALAGIDPETDIRPFDYDQNTANEALREGEIDAFFYTVGNPAPVIETIAEDVGVRFIPLDFPELRAVVEQRPFYVMTTIPEDTYAGMEAPVETFAVTATVIASAELPDEVAYDVVDMVVDDLEDFREGSPAFSHIDSGDLLRGVVAPLHDGAARYFEQVGLRPSAGAVRLDEDAVLDDVLVQP